jgi:hypothetical protein
VVEYRLLRDRAGPAGGTRGGTERGKYLRGNAVWLEPVSRFVSFIGLTTIEGIFTEPKIFFLVLSGTVTNLLLFAGWTGLSLKKSGKVWQWMAAAGVAGATVSLFQSGVPELGPGYWCWLAPSAATAWARRPKFEDYGG